MSFLPLLQDILASLERLRLKYTSAADAAAWHVPVPAPVGVGEPGAPGLDGSVCPDTSGAGTAGGAASEAGIEGWDAHRGSRAAEPHGGGDTAGGCCGGAAGSEGSEEGGSIRPGGGSGAGCGGQGSADACGAGADGRASGTGCGQGLGQGQQWGSTCSGVREFLGERFGALVAAAGLAGGAKRWVVIRLGLWECVDGVRHSSGLSCLCIMPFFLA